MEDIHHSFRNDNDNNDDDKYHEPVSDHILNFIVRIWSESYSKKFTNDGNLASCNFTSSNIWVTVKMTYGKKGEKTVKE